MRGGIEVPGGGMEGVEEEELGEDWSRRRVDATATCYAAGADLGSVKWVTAAWERQRLIETGVEAG